MTDLSTALKPCKEAGRATVEDGLVILDGPDGIAVTMTADAASLTADSLHEAAKQARAGVCAALGVKGALQGADGSGAPDDAA